MNILTNNKLFSSDDSDISKENITSNNNLDFIKLLSKTLNKDIKMDEGTNNILSEEIDEIKYDKEENEILNEFIIYITLLKDNFSKNDENSKETINVIDKLINSIKRFSIDNKINRVMMEDSKNGIVVTNKIDINESNIEEFIKIIDELSLEKSVINNKEINEKIIKDFIKIINSFSNSKNINLSDTVNNDKIEALVNKIETDTKKIDPKIDDFDNKTISIINNTSEEEFLSNISNQKTSIKKNYSLNNEISTKFSMNSDVLTKPIINIDNKFKENITKINVNNITNDISSSIKYMINSNTKELKVSIYPKELGNIDIQVSEKNGLTSITINVDKEDAIKLINAHLPEIKNNLEQININLKEVLLQPRQNLFSQNPHQDNQRKNYLEISKDKDETKKVHEKNINLRKKIPKIYEIDYLA